MTLKTNVTMTGLDLSERIFLGNILIKSLMRFPIFGQYEKTHFYGSGCELSD